jgi:hypothetical protein
MENTPNQLMPVVDAPGLYADGVLTDDSNNLLFLSVWGRDTAIQEFRARLSLPAREGGLDNFRLEQPDGRRLLVQVGDADRLDSMSGRTSSQTIFGALVHLWLYDRLATKPDRANRRALLLFRNDGTDPAQVSRQKQIRDRLWAQVQDTCHLPLLPQWRRAVTESFRGAGWIRRLEGIGVSAFFIDLGNDEVEQVVTRLVRNGRVTTGD